MQNNTRTHYPGCVSSFRSLLPSPSLFPLSTYSCSSFPSLFSLSGALASLSLLWVQFSSFHPWASVPQQPLSPSLWSALAPPPTPPPPSLHHPALPLQGISISTHHFNVNLSLRQVKSCLKSLKKEFPDGSEPFTWFSFFFWNCFHLIFKQTVFESTTETNLYSPSTLWSLLLLMTCWIVLLFCRRNI